jgi:hypothetical protein
MVRILKTNSYKIGVNEIQGLKKAMLEVMKPVKAALETSIYWSDVDLHETEYLSRDGFAAYSHNCGGIQIREIIPKCEEYEFDFLEFGEHDTDCEVILNGEECSCGEGDGLLDSNLKIFLKFEGLDDKGVMSFYLVLHGGNQDAPYFRQSTDIFEADFKAKNITEFKIKATVQIKKMLKVMGY